MKITRWQPYTVPRKILSIRAAAVLFLGEIMLGILVYIFLEDYSLREAFYMTIITISTVGYSEVKPLSPDGQLFTSILIIFNFGIFAYFLSVFSYYVLNGEIFKKMHLNLIDNKIGQLKNHVIVCGFGRYGREVAHHFMSHNMDFVIVESNKEVIDEIQKDDKKILYVEADATQDEALLKAGISNAKALITALPDDSDNLFIVLTARQMNPKLNIISRSTHEKSQRKLQLAGANHIVMPEQIGGFYMATLVSKPGAIEFFSYITREYDSDIEFEELHFATLPAFCRNKAIRDLHIRRDSGANIIGFKKPDGTYVVNPGPDVVLVENSSFIVLGNKEQLAALKKYLDSLV